MKERPLSNDTDLIKVMLAENSQYSVQEILDAINISRKMVDNHLITAINENRLYEPHFYVRFPSSKT